MRIVWHHKLLSAELILFIVSPRVILQTINIGWNSLDVHSSPVISSSSKRMRPTELHGTWMILAGSDPVLGGNVSSWVIVSDSPPGGGHFLVTG